MRTPHFLFLLLIGTFLGCQSPTSDILFVNGSVYPMSYADLKAEALAIQDGKIIFVGTNAEAEAYKSAAGEIVDLDGKALFPSFTDGHIHPIWGGIRLKDCDLTDIRNEAEILQTIRTYVEEHPDKQWIMGANLWLPAVGEGNPAKELLDEIEPDRPMFIQSADGHSAWVNSKALELARVTKETKTPDGGVIERKANGEPSGVLREYAIGLVRNIMPPFTFEEKVTALEEAIALAHSHGITSWIDARVDQEDIEVYAKLEEEGKLNMDVTLSLFGNIIEGMDAVETVLQRYQENHMKLPRLDMKSTKMYIDGVIEGKTAALFENYTGEDFTGSPYIKADLYNQMVAAFDSAGIQVHIHACGDKGIRMTLDAFEYAREKNGPRDSRHHIVHMQVMDPKDVGRFKKLDVIANFQPLWATPEDSYISELTIPVLGPERSEWIYPLGAVAKSGAKIAHGSDWPVTSANPMLAMQVAVTRRGPDSVEREPWTPQHLVGMYDVLEGYTAGGAYLMFKENTSGTLEVGKEANLVVMEEDPFTISKFELYKLAVSQTYWKGKKVYQKEE
ncbi:MAG: amidohydrolase [Bacteroidota bacterium]